MPSHVLVNKLGLTYKGSVGVSTATLPDVCKTPTPGGPVPIPYPNFADKSSLKKGTKTVKAKGKMIAVKGSEYSMSFGDEPGTAGGIKSSTFKKETSWITYSFDVKMDGKNACRHTDKKFHNHKNTVDLQGNVDPAVALAAAEKTFKCAVKECDNMDLSKDQKEEVKNAKSPCGKLGSIKHECVKQKMQDCPGAENEPSYDTGRTPAERLMRSEPNQHEPCSNFYSAWASVNRNCKSDGIKYKKGRMRRPDCVIGDKVLDAKFPCSRNVKRGAFGGRNRFPSANTPGEKMWRRGQKDAYKKIAGKGAPKPKAIAPNDVRNLRCP